MFNTKKATSLLIASFGTMVFLSGCAGMQASKFTYEVIAKPTTRTELLL